MNMYTTPKEGTYSHNMPNFDGTFRESPVRVDVLGESDKMYLVRLWVPLGGHRQFDQIRVLKHNVRVHGMSAPVSSKHPARSYDYTNAFWND